MEIKNKSSSINHQSSIVLRCPKCGSTDIAAIVYQPVEMTESLIAQIRARKVVVRPAPSDGARLRYYCHYCRYEW